MKSGRWQEQEYQRNTCKQVSQEACFTQTMPWLGTAASGNHVKDSPSLKYFVPHCLLAHTVDGQNPFRTLKPWLKPCFVGIYVGESTRSDGILSGGARSGFRLTHSTNLSSCSTLVAHMLDNAPQIKNLTDYPLHITMPPIK